jgi:hypothetical protein
LLFVQEFFFPGARRSLWSNPLLVMTHVADLAMIGWLLIRGVNAAESRRLCARRCGCGMTTPGGLRKRATRSDRRLSGRPSSGFSRSRREALHHSWNPERHATALARVNSRLGLSG